MLTPDVINLVVAAREFWDANNDLSDESRALDKALEAFSGLVPYENQPDDAALSVPAAAVVGEPEAWVDPVSLEILREENITTTNLLAHEQDGFVAVYLSAPDSRLRQALEFYRDEWEQDVDAELTHGGWTGSLGDLEPSDDLMKDKGEIARAALSAAHSSPDDDSPQELFARWLNDGPKLAKAAGVYVGVSVKPLPAPPALGGKP